MTSPPGPTTSSTPYRRGCPSNADLDTTLTVLAGNSYRLLARACPVPARHPDRLWRHSLDNTGQITVTEDHFRVDVNLRTYTPPIRCVSFVRAR